MSDITEQTRLCDILVGESQIHNRYSRDKVTIAAGQNLAIGTVIGKITASGQVTQVNFASDDGSQIAHGIVIDDYDAVNGLVKGAAIVRNAVVRESALVWPVGATTEQMAGALAQLEERGIVNREIA